MYLVFILFDVLYVGPLFLTCCVTFVFFFVEYYVVVVLGFVYLFLIFVLSLWVLYSCDLLFDILVPLCSSCVLLYYLSAWIEIIKGIN